MDKIIKIFFSSFYLLEPWKNYILISLVRKVGKTCHNSFQVLFCVCSYYSDLSKERVEHELFQNQNSLHKISNAFCTWGADSKVHAKHLIHEYPFPKCSRSLDLHLFHILLWAIFKKKKRTGKLFSDHKSHWWLGNKKGSFTSSDVVPHILVYL